MSTRSSNEKLDWLNIAVVVLSIYVLVAMVVYTFVPLREETSKLLHYIDNALCAFFFVEFCIRFSRAKNKWKFMRWGWIDLIASIPMIYVLHAARVFRLLKLLRILRAVRSMHHLTDALFKDKAKGSVAIATLLAVLLLFFSSVEILHFETAPDSNIKTAEDAIWWSFVTITTVGYGDKYPVTTGGRVIAMVLMTCGFGLFSTLTAYLATWFVASFAKKENTTTHNLHIADMQKEGLPLKSDDRSKEVVSTEKIPQLPE